jgi:hypothetical protein
MNWRRDEVIVRFAGICGVLGALLFFAGDMLFYGFFGSAAEFAANASRVTMHRSTRCLMVGGLVGPPAAALCIIGFWHVFRHVSSVWVTVGKLMLAAFFFLMVTGSAVHTLWAAKGLAVKYCAEQAGPCGELLSTIRQYWTVAYDMSAVAGYFGAGILFFMIVFGVTSYPRWMVLTNPGVLALCYPTVLLIPSPLGAIVAGGFTNLTIAVFFLASTLVTWRKIPSHSGGVANPSAITAYDKQVS